MEVVVWVTEATWPACVEAVRTHVPASAHVTLLHVVDEGVAGVAVGALAGLLGRSGRDRVPEVGALASAAGLELLAAAADDLGREATVTQRSGRVEREVVQALAGADLLILARDGDLRRLGPHSLGPATRFVVDHAPCATLLVWPGPAPEVASIPRPPD